MPIFSTPEKQDIQNSQLIKDFKEGDLLYGLDAREEGEDKTGERHVYMKILEKEKRKYITVDRLNNKVLCIISGSNDELIEPTPEEQSYWNYLKTFKDREKYPNYNFKAMQGNDDEYILRKLCKAALFRENVTIRFCLDGISIKRAASQIFYSEKQSKYEVENKFTAAELRFIYRHWDELKDKICFYENGMQVQAPWHNKDSEWNLNYQNGKRSQAFAEELNQAFQKGFQAASTQIYIPRAKRQKVEPSISSPPKTTSSYSAIRLAFTAISPTKNNHLPVPSIASPHTPGVRELRKRRISFNLTPEKKFQKPDVEENVVPRKTNPVPRRLF